MMKGENTSSLLGSMDSFLKQVVGWEIYLNKSGLLFLKKNVNNVKDAISSVSKLCNCIFEHDLFSWELSKMCKQMKYDNN